MQPHVTKIATMLEFDDIRFDCVYYTGYKPCRYGNECGHCPFYEPREPFWANVAQPVALYVREKDTQRTREGFRVVIIKTGAMGDVLRTTTLLPPILRAHPDAHITWVTDKSAIPLLVANPNIHRLLALDETTAALLSNEQFDLLLNFEKEKEPLQLAGMIPARVHRGFAPTHWGTPTVFNDASRYALLLGVSDELKFRVNKKTYPEIIAEMAELPYERDPYQLYLTPEGIARVKELEEVLRDKPRPRIGLNTGCGSVFRTKLWPLERWIELISELQERLPQATFLLLGGPAEREMNAEILARTQGITDTGCDNSLEAFIGVVQTCDVVVSSDSLAMHIAIALQKLVVALFGSTSPVEIDLYDRGEKVITDFECSPCYLKQCDKAPNCMQAMSGKTVAEAVLRVLQHSANCA